MSEPRNADLGRELSAAVVMFHEAVGARLGLRASDQRALALISRHGPITAGQLAEHTGLTPGAITGMIDRLERAGLASRNADPADRRRVLISSTGKGGDSAIFRDLAEAMNAVTSRYTESEQRLIADYVTRTISVLREQTRKLTER
ncbi:MarR family winged helix-turn-helix transcriptional regulator [Saccharomonospora xinjiangensis]|uniref:MarR family winged helix-turn-helix transcriptional regulator n=1 Tax=Saccharomonospora xinjiangensis TaxID=75294 RepID=UPI00350F74DB